MTDYRYCVGMTKETAMKLAETSIDLGDAVEKPDSVIPGQFKIGKDGEILDIIRDFENCDKKGGRPPKYVKK